MKFTLSVVKRSGKAVENTPKPMDFFAFEISLALDMMRKRQIDEFTVKVTRGSPKQKPKRHACGKCNLLMCQRNAKTSKVKVGSKKCPECDADIPKALMAGMSLKCKNCGAQLESEN